MIASLAAGSFIFNLPIDNFNFVQTVHAEVKTYTGAGDCVQSELVTAAQAKNYARLRAEINAKEQAGVYIRGYTKMKNFNLTENKIEVIASSILNIVGDVKYAVETMVWGNSPLIKHIATLRANIDTDGLTAYLRRDAGEKTQSELQSTTKDIKENLDKRYNKATNQAEKDKISVAFSRDDKNVLA